MFNPILNLFNSLGLNMADKRIEAYREVEAEQLKQRTRGDKVVVIVEAASLLVA